MIPTIEQIIYDLLAGKMDEPEATGLIKQHIDLARLAAEADDLRDHFAGRAMQGMLADGDANNMSGSEIANYAYSVADAMLIARQS